MIKKTCSTAEAGVCVQTCVRCPGALDSSFMGVYKRPSTPAPPACGLNHGDVTLTFITEAAATPSVPLCSNPPTGLCSKPLVAHHRVRWYGADPKKNPFGDFCVRFADTQGSNLLRNHVVWGTLFNFSQHFFFSTAKLWGDHVL